jgi:hypothetical protein
MIPLQCSTKDVAEDQVAHIIGTATRSEENSFPWVIGPGYRGIRIDRFPDRSAGFLRYQVQIFSRVGLSLHDHIETTSLIIGLL